MTDSSDFVMNAVFPSSDVQLIMKLSPSLTIREFGSVVIPAEK